MSFARVVVWMVRSLYLSAKTTDSTLKTDVIVVVMVFKI